MDPISAIGIATTAYNAIKRGFKVGKEIEGMSKDLGRWMGAIQAVRVFCCFKKSTTDGK